MAGLSRACAERASKHSGSRPSQQACGGVYFGWTDRRGGADGGGRARTDGNGTELADSQLLAHGIRFHARSSVAGWLQCNTASEGGYVPMSCYTSGLRQVGDLPYI